jgi:peptidoglycan/xylan/chitin deacetylase (PgdA/CDA1 family)
LEIISQVRTFVRLEDTIEALKSGEDLPPSSTLLTFDDGYIDNYTNALPILQEFGAPACFFVPVNRVESRRLEWWDQIARLVNLAKPGRYELHGAESSIDIPEVASQHSRQGAISHLIQAYKAGRLEIDSIAKTFHSVAEDPDAESGHIMTDEQIRDIVSIDGYTIGGHSVTHRVLSRLTVAEQEHEIMQSKERLERRFNTPIRAFAYPVGGVNDYDADTRRIVREAGYDCAFNFRMDASLENPQRADRFDIDRLCLPAAEESTLRARVSGFQAI